MDPTQSQDHDLLIEVRTELKAIRADIKDLKDGTTSRLTNLENGKLDTKEAERVFTEHGKLHDDVEKRLRFIERYVWGAIAIVALIELAVQMLQYIPK